MGLISLTLPTIGQPNSTEDVDVLNSLSTIQTVLNGNIDAANITDGSITATELATAAKPATLLGAYRLLHKTHGMTNTTTTTNMFVSGSEWITVNTSGAFALDLFYLDPADFAVSGLTAKLRLRLTVATNGTAPGVGFTGHMLSPTVGGGANLLTITGHGGSSVSTSSMSAPSANTITTVTSADTNLPAAGNYFLSLGPGGALAANSRISAGVELWIRWV